MKLNKRAFALISGGLDSMVAVKILHEQGIHVIGVYFASLFYQPREKREQKSAAERSAHEMGIQLIIFKKDIEFMRMIQNPQHGYGSAINPCIDCRIYYLKKIIPLMQKYDVTFVATGEVLGQRPKSQMRDALNIIERDSGLKGYLVRPLCAHHLEPTIMEQEGILDRDKLRTISGRGRKEQMVIAEKYGLTEYPNPAGGCQFTEKEFVPKVVDLFTHGYSNDDDITLLTCGRHFRINNTTKMIVTRNEDEGDFVIETARDDEICVVPHDFSGPVVLIKGSTDEGMIEIAAGLLQYFSKRRGEENVYVDVIKGTSNEPCRTIHSVVLREEDVEDYRLKVQIEKV